MAHNLRVGDRVIIAWRHWNGREGARFGVVSKITAAGYVYAGYAADKWSGDEFPLRKVKSKRLGNGDYSYKLLANTPENREAYHMPDRAPAGVVFKKPRARPDHAAPQEPT